MLPDISILRNTKSWPDFVEAITPLRQDERGAAFEGLTELYLQIQPEYRTTIKHYTVLGLTDTARGMDQVPSIGKSKRNMATGTCENNPQQYLQQSQHGRGRNHANRRDKPATGTDGNANTQSSVSAGKCATTRDGATLNEPPAGVAQLVERQLGRLPAPYGSAA